MALRAIFILQRLKCQSMNPVQQPDLSSPALGAPVRKKGWFKRFRHWLLESWAFYAFVRSFVWFVAILPRPVSQFIGRAGGRVAYWLDRGHRSICESNLQIAFPEKTSAERTAILKACYSHLGRCATDFCLLTRASKEYVLNTLLSASPENIAVGREAFGEGRGVICTAAHIGFWELSGFVSKIMNYDLVSVSRKLPAPRLEAFIARVRQRMGNQIINQEGALRVILRALKENRGAGILVDLHAGRESPWIPFFGKEASTYDSAARLHLKTGAALVLALTVRGDDGYYKLIARRIRPTAIDGNEDAQIRHVLVTINAELEKVIREYPEQWVWMHKRWRKKPE